MMVMLNSIYDAVSFLIMVLRDVFDVFVLIIIIILVIVT